MEHMINSVMPKNVFPEYSDGDVLIVLNPDQHFQLHSINLRTNSEFFRELLTEETAIGLAPKAKKSGVSIRWRVELQLARAEDGTESTEVGILKLRELNPQGKPRYREGFAALSLPAGRAVPLVYTHYANLLRCYYHQPVKLGAGSTSSSFALTLRDVVGLTDIAESLGSIPCVSANLDVALLNQGEMLYRSIASNATVWADLALRVRSEIMFRESVIHLVGNYNTLSSPPAPSAEDTDTETPPPTLEGMKPALRALVEKKAADLDEHKKAIEARILGHYPQQLQVLLPGEQNVGTGSRTLRGAVNAAPTRQSAYSNKVMDWMALCLFRHWLGQSIAGEMSRRAPDGGHKFYTAIAAGKEAYLDQSAREAFCRHFPMSAKARTLFDRAVWDIKEAVKGYVDELVGRRCHLDTVKWPVGWLTCVDVRAEEMPWVEDERLRKERERVFGVGAEGGTYGVDQDGEDGATRVRGLKRKMKDRMAGVVDTMDDIDEEKGGAAEGLEMIRRQQRYQDRKKIKLAAASSPSARIAVSPVANAEGDVEDAADNNDNVSDTSSDGLGATAFEASRVTASPSVDDSLLEGERELEPEDD